MNPNSQRIDETTIVKGFIGGIRIVEGEIPSWAKARAGISMAIRKKPVTVASSVVCRLTGVDV